MCSINEIFFDNFLIKGVPLYSPFRLNYVSQTPIEYSLTQTPMANKLLQDDWAEKV